MFFYFVFESPPFSGRSFWFSSSFITIDDVVDNILDLPSDVRYFGKIDFFGTLSSS